MRTGRNTVVNLLVFVLAEGLVLVSAGSEPPKHTFSPRNNGLKETNENLNRARAYKANNESVKRMANRWFTTENKARKHSEFANGSGTVEGNRLGPQHGKYETIASSTSQTPNLIADYGILGISDDEDSARWASDEMKKAAANKEKTSGAIQNTENVRNASSTANMLKQISMKDSSQGLETSAKITPANSTEKSVAKVNDLQALNGNITGSGNSTDVLFQVTNLPKSEKAPIPVQTATFADGSELNNITAKVTRPGSMIYNTTLTNAQQPQISNATVNHTAAAEQLNTAQGIKMIEYGESIPKAAMHQTASEVIQNNAPRNASESKLKAVDNQTVSTSLSPKKNQTQLSEQFSAQAQAPSLEINVTSLRKDQSFDLQIPSPIPPKGSYQDNHFHFDPKETHSSSEYSPKDLEKNSSNSFFLNATLDKISAEEQEKGRQPNKFLQKLNSDILSSRAEPLTNNENLGSDVTDETFREESPAGRTFAENLQEPNSNDALLNRRPSSVHGQESQAEIQQDENLARALNSSSVSSVIFSANRALFDTDKEVFSKKSAQGRLNSTNTEQRNKRSNLLQHLAKNRKNSLPSKLHSPRKSHTSGEHGKKHREVTARQVINLGNHFLWFGGQSSADVNGFPRHNTATETAPYNVNGYISNFLNTEDGNEVASTTKGYKALQNALTSMESNQDGQSDPSIADAMFALPNNKEWQNSDQRQTPASVIIQDKTGKPVYQGVVDIVKLNDTKSNDSVNSESGKQSNNVLIGQNDEASSKENESDHNANHQDSPSNTNSSSENATYDIGDSSNSMSAYQNSSTNGNKTVTQNAEGSTGHLDGRNTTLPGGGRSDQTHIPEKQGVKQVDQMQSEVQDLPKLSNQTQKNISPSAIIKKISTNSQEPETYHVIVNDAGKKITNANGHVTVIISGPTATQASMPSESTLLIPQTSPSNWSPENDYVSSDKNAHLAMGENADRDFTTLSQNVTSGSKNFDNASSKVNKTDEVNANQKAALSLLQQEIAPALKISDGIEGQFRNGEADEAIPIQDKTQDQTKQALGARATKNENNNTQNRESTESLMENGHSFVHVGQDLAGSVDGLQMEEVSRPNVQPEQQKEQENLLEGPTGGFIEGEDQYAGPMQPQDVPTLNIVLNPTQRIHGSLSVGGRVIPISSARDRDSQTRQQLDCHANPKNEKTSTTVLTCQKKHNLGNFQSFGKSLSPLTGGDIYYGNPRMTGGPALQLNQVMNVLNDQVKATINKEMKTESKDIENVLTGMTVPSSTLMDTEEAYSQSDPPQRSSLMDTVDEKFTSPPDFERPGKNRRPYHRKVHQFEFPYHFGFPQHIGFSHHHGFPHRRHYFRYSHHSNPFVVMAHKDSDEGFWDYQHNIFIPRDLSREDDNDDEEEENREKHWGPLLHRGHRRGNWIMAHPPMQSFHPRFSPFREPDLVHLRLPTIFGRSGPWRPVHQMIKTAPQVHKQEQGAKRTSVVHKALRGDRDMCRPIIEGPSPPLKGEWEYLGKVLSSCPCRLTDSEW